MGLARAGRAARARRLRADEPVRPRSTRARPATTLDACSASPAPAGSGFEDDPSTPFAFADGSGTRSGRSLLVAAAGARRGRAAPARTDLVLVSFVLAYWLPLVPLEAHFDRYVLPLVPVLGVLAGSSAGRRPSLFVACSCCRSPGRRRRRELTRTDTRAAGRCLGRRQRPPRRPVAADPSTLPLAAGEVVRLELPGPGRPFDPRAGPRRAPRRQGVRWVVVGRRDRSRARRGRPLPARGAFYDASATALAAFARTRASPGRRALGRASTVSGYLRGMSASAPGGRDLDRGLRLRRGAARGRDHGEPGARADLRQLALRLGLADRRGARRPRPRLRAGRLVADRNPTGACSPRVLAVGALLVLAIPLVDQACSTAIAAWDPGPRLDPLLAAAAALRPDEHRPRLGDADRGPARCPLARAARPNRRAAVLGLDRREHRRDVRDRVLARSRARHGPGAGARRGGAARRGAPRRARGAPRRVAGARLRAAGGRGRSSSRSRRRPRRASRAARRATGRLW